MFRGCWCLHIISSPIADHVLTISLPTATRAELTAKCEGGSFWGCCRLHTISLPIADNFLTISLPFPYHFLTISLPSATRAELTARCEGSRFGVAVYTNMSSKWQVGLVIFPIALLIKSRTNSDLFRPSVHHPLFLPHAPYESLMASPL